MNGICVSPTAGRILVGGGGGGSGGEKCDDGDINDGNRTINNELSDDVNSIGGGISSIFRKTIEPPPSPNPSSSNSNPQYSSISSSSSFVSSSTLPISSSSLIIPNTFTSSTSSHSSNSSSSTRPTRAHGIRKLQKCLSTSVTNYESAAIDHQHQVSQLLTATNQSTLNTSQSILTSVRQYSSFGSKIWIKYQIKNHFIFYYS
ncbi:hypothetical protein PV327_010765 [Microctonus hyperodae]|uniref:Uncharacterized protein n=1 Tax=Microctonus hyperodae TaxID=165561 RepID=A0AA39C8H2_MICHY|nr:hypothetical protein PV327_010765 [Microctonus hyperodae]